MEPMHVMAADRVGQPPIPLQVVVHNATVILSGVLLGLLLGFITSQLGRLRHQISLLDRLVNRIPFGGLAWVAIVLLPLWIIWLYPYVDAFLTPFRAWGKEKASYLVVELSSRVIPAASIHETIKASPTGT